MNRAEMLQRAVERRTPWDMVIVGGGATGAGIAVDAAGSAYVMGDTSSGATSFPDGDGFGAVPGYDQTLAGVAYPTYGAAPDVFVLKFDPAGAAVRYATYLGVAGTAGQRCTSLRRLIVHESIADELLKRLLAIYEKLPIGDPTVPERCRVGRA